MAGTIRHKSNAGWEIQAPVDAGTSVEIGDLLFLTSTGYATPVSSMGSFTGSPDEGELHETFLGVSNSATTGNETTDTNISVAVDGHFEYPVTALGEASIVMSYVGGVTSGGALLDQQLQIVATIGDAIGYLVAPAALGDTRLKCRLLSSLGQPVQEVV